MKVGLVSINNCSNCALNSRVINNVTFEKSRRQKDKGDTAKPENTEPAKPSDSSDFPRVDWVAQALEIVNNAIHAQESLGDDYDPYDEEGDFFL